MAKVEFRNVGFRYGKRWIFRGLNISFEGPGLVAITGSSGSGKTTLLKLIAGLVQPHEGEVSCKSKSTAWVPQDIGLFPWMTVMENIAFPLRLEGKTALERQTIVTPIYEALGIEHASDSLPGRISGGEGQRVGIARALAANADLLLMDEPFSALDDGNVENVVRLVWQTFVEGQSGLGLITSHRNFLPLVPNILGAIDLDECSYGK